jgi:hypothetical protein
MEAILCYQILPSSWDTPRYASHTDSPWIGIEFLWIHIWKRYNMDLERHLSFSEIIVVGEVDAVDSNINCIDSLIFVNLSWSVLFVSF